MSKGLSYCQHRCTYVSQEHGQEGADEEIGDHGDDGEGDCRAQLCNVREDNPTVQYWQTKSWMMNGLTKTPMMLLSVAFTRALASLPPLVRANSTLVETAGASEPMMTKLHEMNDQRDGMM